MRDRKQILINSISIVLAMALVFSYYGTYSIGASIMIIGCAVAWYITLSYIIYKLSKRRKSTVRIQTVVFMGDNIDVARLAENTVLRHPTPVTFNFTEEVLGQAELAIKDNTIIADMEVERMERDVELYPAIGCRVNGETLEIENITEVSLCINPNVDKNIPAIRIN